MSNLRIVLWNCNGLNARKLEFDAFLETEKIDVALVTETHGTNMYSWHSTHCYSVWHTFHPSGKAQGGVAVYVKKSLRATPDRSYASPKIQLCSVTIQMGTAPLTIASLYCTPSIRTTAAEFDIAFQHLGHGPWICGGDYNAKHPLWGSRYTTTRGRQLHQTILSSGLEAISSGQPTYWPTHQNRLPDILDFFVTQGIPRARCRATTVADLNSDHIPVVLTVSSRPLASVLPPPLVNRYTDWDNFREIITERSCHGQSIVTVDDLEDHVRAFTHLVQWAAEQSTPPLPQPREPEKVQPQVRALLHRRRAARKRWQQTRSPSARKELSTLNNEVKNALCSARNAALSSFLRSLAPTPTAGYSLWHATRKFRREPVQPLPPPCEWRVDSR